MKRSNLNADDVAWMRQRLRSTLTVLLLMVVLSWALREKQQEHAPGAMSAGPPAQLDEPRTSRTTFTATRTTTSERRSVLPTGWRRTNRGWEHVSNWPTTAQARSASLGEIIAHQRRTEPRWLRDLMALLRSIPPLGFAGMQIAAVSVIAHLGTRQTAK